MENNLLHNPIKIVVYDPIHNKNLRTFTFIGDVPKRIKYICININKYGVNEINTSDKNLLKEFFGNNWKCKLGIDIKTISDTITGGENNIIERDDDINWEELSSDEFDTSSGKTYLKTTEDDMTALKITETDLKRISTQLPTQLPTQLRATITEADTSFLEFKPGIEFITDVSIYPEDKLVELREKIYLSIGIPFYRQHIFYIEMGQSQVLYRLYINSLYQIDIKKLTEYKNHVLDIPIDIYLYNNRDSIKIESYDSFRLIGTSLSLNNIIYVVDLDQLIRNIKSELTNIINDKYQFDLLYYGFIVKYFPHMDTEVLKTYLENENELYQKYPDLAISKSYLKKKYTAEKDIIDFTYSKLHSAMNWYNKQTQCITLSITQMTASPIGLKYPVNIRNLFDLFSTSLCYPEVRAYIEHENKKYLLRKTYVTDKNNIIFPSNLRSGLTIAISLRKEDQESYHKRKTISTTENELSRYIFVNIQSSGIYIIKSLWNEEDELGFDDVIEVLHKYTEKLITIINNYGYKIFPQGGKFIIVNKNNIQYHSLNVSLFWKKAISDKFFKFIGENLSKFIISGITKLRGFQHREGYEFVFSKGMTEFDPLSIERTIAAGTDFTVSNTYLYLSNNLIKQKWEQLYSGRVVKITHRTTDVKFEVINIHENEFSIFLNYMITFIWNMISEEKAGKDKISITKISNDINDKKSVKHLKKLQN